MCHVSCVTCHVSYFMCHMLHVFVVCFVFDNNKREIVGAKKVNICQNIHIFDVLQLSSVQYVLVAVFTDDI